MTTEPMAWENELGHYAVAFLDLLGQRESARAGVHDCRRRAAPKRGTLDGMARDPFQPRTSGAYLAEGSRSSLPGGTPPEHAITRLYMLPAGSAAEVMAEIEDETEEPTPALRDLFRVAAR